MNKITELPAKQNTHTHKRTHTHAQTHAHTGTNAHTHTHTNTPPNSWSIHNHSENVSAQFSTAQIENIHIKRGLKQTHTNNNDVDTLL